MLVVIGLGSNQGDSRHIIESALARLRAFAIPGSFQQSDLWGTSPVDCPPGSGDFINAVASFEAAPGITPEALLADLKALEREYGRGTPYVRNAPRELDLDLLLFGDETRDTEVFTLPHPRAAERKFVLAPAAQIIGELIWPGTGRTVSQLLAELETDEHVQTI